MRSHRHQLWFEFRTRTSSFAFLILAKKRRFCIDSGNAKGAWESNRCAQALREALIDGLAHNAGVVEVRFADILKGVRALSLLPKLVKFCESKGEQLQLFGLAGNMSSFGFVKRKRLSFQIVFNPPIVVSKR